MLTQRYRPQSFSEVSGSPFALKVLRGVAKNPKLAPRSLLLSGPQGSGKTTSARILPKALHCLKGNGDACGKCAKCTDIQDGSGHFVEYNCAHVGGVSGIRTLQERFLYSFSEGYRVIIFDEVHLISPEAQGALLESLESAPPELFFLFCTTEPTQILSTIKSRSLEIEFSPLPDDTLIATLKKISDREGFSFSQEVYTRIARRTFGDARMALHKLEEAMIVGEESWLKQVVLLDDQIAHALRSAVDGNVPADSYAEEVSVILRNPVQYIRKDFERQIVELSDKLFVEKDLSLSRLEPIVTDWLRMQRMLEGRNDWNIFFNYLRKHAGTSAGKLSIEDRFKRQD